MCNVYAHSANPGLALHVLVFDGSSRFVGSTMTTVVGGAIVITMTLLLVPMGQDHTTVSGQRRLGAAIETTFE